MHLCPKLGRAIVIDTEQTPVCLSCKFQVYKLAIKSHKYFKLSIILHFVPLSILMVSLWVFQTEPINTLFLVLPWNVVTCLFASLLIHLKSEEFYKTMVEESHNWARRTR